MQASSSGYMRLNSITEYEDSDDLALVGFLRSTFGMREVYHNFSGEGIVATVLDMLPRGSTPLTASPTPSFKSPIVPNSPSRAR